MRIFLQNTVTIFVFKSNDKLIFWCYLKKIKIAICPKSSFVFLKIIEGKLIQRDRNWGGTTNINFLIIFENHKIWKGIWNQILRNAVKLNIQYIKFLIILDNFSNYSEDAFLFLVFLDCLSKFAKTPATRLSVSNDSNRAW